MLEKVDLNRKMGKKEYKEWMDDLQPKLSYLQRACKEQKIPVMIVFEGFGAAVKGTMINKIIEEVTNKGAQAIWFTARTHLTKFYNSFGFKEYGEEFLIPNSCMHIKMYKSLI